jgi:capsule polysaccharide export protein KpsE/RkpR
MAEYIYSLLDSAMIDISIGKASRNRVFIESQFVAAQEKFDSLQLEFKEFQLANKAFDISEQMKITLKVYADIKSASIMNDLKLTALRREYVGNTPEIAEAMDIKKIYDKKLAELEQKNDHSVIPSLNMASELMPMYVNLYRSLEVQNQIILLLTKELEQARLQEARDVSPLVLIDPPYRAEYKARPKRAPMVFMITASYMSFLMLIVIAQKLIIDFFRFGVIKPQATKVSAGAREQEQYTRN